MALPIVEYFTQAAASDRLGKETTEVRGARRKLVARARQKRDGAEALWAVSQPAEALALMRDALVLFEEAANEAGTGDDLGAKLASLGIGKRAADRAQKTLSGITERELPSLDTDVKSKDGETFRELADVVASLDDALADIVLVKREIVVRRLMRSTLTVLGTVLAVVGAYFLLRTPPPPPAAASAIYGEDPAYGPDRAIDGDASTDWLLPDATAGWLDVRVQPAKALRQIRLINGHNRDYNDRAVRAYRIEVYDGDHMVTQTSGTFPSLVPHPTPVVIPLRAAHATRVRFVVVSWFALGSALAEIHPE